MQRIMSYRGIYVSYDKKNENADSFLQLRNLFLSEVENEGAVFENEKALILACGSISKDQFSLLIEKGPNILRGAFAIFYFDKSSNEFIVIRDHLGMVPVYYCEDNGIFHFSTEIKTLFNVSGFEPVVDEQWIADSVSTLKSEKWRTFYKGIKKVEPGCLCRISNENCIHERYWNLEEVEERRDLTYSAAVERYHDLLVQAVERSCKSDAQIASELSGGLDSSGVTAIADMICTKRKSSLSVLSHAFSDKSKTKYFPYKDETVYAKMLCEYLNLPGPVICHADHSGILSALKANIANQYAATQQGYSLFSDVLYEQAEKENIGILFSGFGGDECVSSPAKAYLLELAWKKNWSKYRKVLFSRESHQSRAYKISKYIIVRYLPFVKTSLKRLYLLLTSGRYQLSLLAIHPDFEKKMHISTRYSREYMPRKYSRLRDVQYDKIMHNHVSQRFEYSYHNAGRYGIKYAYPLWDIDLLEFYFSLPSEFKHKGVYSRAIFRDAMKGILPEEIRMRRDKSVATIPTIHQRFLKDYDEIILLINESSETNNYHYLDCNKMLEWTERLKDWGKGKVPVLPGPYFNSLQILLLQQMQRKGEFNSGISV